MLRYDYVSMTDNICMESGAVPEDWEVWGIILVYKARVDRRDCANYRGINILSMLGKMYCRILINRIAEDAKKYVLGVKNK